VLSCTWPVIPWRKVDAMGWNQWQKVLAPLSVALYNQNDNGTNDRWRFIYVPSPIGSGNWKCRFSNCVLFWREMTYRGMD